MTAVEVLAPLRIETRFVAPADRPDGVDQWLLRLRVYPDEFSIRRGGDPPSPAELDRLAEALASLTASPRVDEPAAFASLASAVGAARALHLWRTAVVDDAAGGRTVDRATAVERSTSRTPHAPVGLPERLEVWLIGTDGARDLVAELALDLVAIAADLELSVFHVADGRLPETWWLSYERAVAVGLGVDLDLGPEVPRLDSIIVVGVGDTPAADLVDAHNAAGRLAVLAQGSSTNTVQGEPTTDLGQDAESWAALLPLAAGSQRSTVAVLSALTGRVPDTALPMLGGDVDYYGPGALAVRAFWPVLWGRALRDVLGAGALELRLRTWARDHLAVEGPFPAVRVGEQPYGLLPTSVFETWQPDPDDNTALSEVEERLWQWAQPWRAGAARAARAADGRVHGADTEKLLDVMTRNAPTRHWRVRPVMNLHVVQAMRALSGLPADGATEWDRASARAWRDIPYPLNPRAPAGGLGALPAPPFDERDDPGLLREMLSMSPETLYFGQLPELGLVGHLVRETLVVARAVVGEAVHRFRAGDPVELGEPLPFEAPAFIQHVISGDDVALEELRLNSDDNGATLANSFLFQTLDPLGALADLWESEHDALFAGVLAALDTAAFRVDPWLTGIARRRLARLTERGAPFLLGAYGWVDAPAPYAGPGDDALAPGPTAAGLLHAPSHAQALTAALLRAAAVRDPGDDRWRIALDSAKVRAAVQLGERVRLGVHPYEALGLEVERAAGDWDTVRVLRRDYPLAPAQHLRRVCDGAQVLRAARAGELGPDLAARLAPLDAVLDTYADLLVADGVHALVSGRADLAGAAMEASAGLGAPPELRALRTPRAAATVRVSAWAVLDPGPDGEGRPFAWQDADPAFAALVAGSDDDEASRLAALLGGGEDDPPLPTLTGGDHEGVDAGSADTALRQAMAADLRSRLSALVRRAEATRGALDLVVPQATDVVREFVAPWLLPLPDGDAKDLQGPAQRLLDERATAAQAVAGDPAASVNALRRAMRALAGRRDLPVLPVVDRALLPVLRGTPGVDASWLEVVAAVRPRLAALDAWQLDPDSPDWSAAVAAPDGSSDPWHPAGPVVVAYGPAAARPDGRVAVTALDAWTDSVPSRRHATSAAFGFNAPKARAPQAVLLAVPPDISVRLTSSDLVLVVLGTRELAHARGAAPDDVEGLPYATPGALVHFEGEWLNFLVGWPS